MPNNIRELFWIGLFTVGAAAIQVRLPLIILLLGLYAYIRVKKMHIRHCSVKNMFLMFLISYAIACYVSRQDGAFFWIPFAFTPILVTILFNDLELSFIMTLAVSFGFATLSARPFQVFSISFIAGLVGSIASLNARQRSAVIKAGFFTAIAQTVTFFLFDLYTPQSFVFYSSQKYMMLSVNGIVWSIVVLGVLPLFEYLFKAVTNISLLELADFNHPLLQRLILEAPGTYHHSLVVGNLAEGACNAAGANALLARIGAYYHDVGKLDKAEYFSENQNIDSSKHDELTPTMSKLVIMNHVKEGIELARKYKLNDALIEFIVTHHGTSLVYYFYRRALANMDENQEISEEGFRYPGPKPTTKETAIVLLADSVEAATRALKDPTPEKIRELVHKIINNKFIDGQLDESGLTLQDLNRISVVFVRLLGGIYHSRISYPEETPKAQ